eukprot:TRINITY_DN3059_c0_g1_i1.p1 TRINITY_DN3059_c0_g1~~TRINITY_DN3059_c0_g1_i1.p1  ORF type:complete len:230 (-),score=41.38 TRINITY_DN3059_c0_g1_i1:487-1176(-)
MPDFEQINAWEHNNLLEHSELSNYKIGLSDQNKHVGQVDTTELFNSLTSSSKYDTDPTQDIDGQEGLGRLPENIEDVSSMLLFNTAENPYKEYASFNNLEGIGGTDREKESKELSDAPQTMRDGDIMPTFASEQFGFKPRLGAVPTLNFQSVLPGLAHVAELNWCLDESSEPLPSIAPSLLPINQLPTVEFYQQSMADAKTASQKAPIGGPMVGENGAFCTSSSIRCQR